MQARTIPAAKDQATIVCCVECGRLETQTLLMLETLRRWGGPLGQSRVLAVKPRRGGRLASETRAGLREFGAELHDGTRHNVMPWYNYYGKVVAARVAEEVATTPVVIWLDSDAFVVEPLRELGLPHGDDFTARREPMVPAVFDESSRFVNYWRRACEVVGVRWEDVPWLPADGAGFAPQRLSFNAGIYAFRRGLGFPEVYADCMRRLMRARLAMPDGNFWLNEQCALALAIVRSNLKFRELPLSENHMVFQSLIDGPGRAPSVADARLIHYSGSMYPHYWPRFMKRLQDERPSLHEWLSPFGPIEEKRTPSAPLALAYKVSRNLRYRSFAKRCVRVT